MLYECLIGYVAFYVCCFMICFMICFEFICVYWDEEIARLFEQLELNEDVIDSVVNRNDEDEFDIKLGRC